MKKILSLALEAIQAKMEESMQTSSATVATPTASSSSFLPSLSSLTWLGDEDAHGLAFAALEEPGQVEGGPEAELVKLFFSVVRKLFVAGKYKSLGDMLSPDNVAMVTALLPGGKKQQVLLPNDTPAGSVAEALGSLLGVPAASVEVQGDQQRALRDGDEIRVALHADRARELQPEALSTAPRTPLPRAPSAKEPNPDRPDHVVVLMLENRSFDHMLGKVKLPPGHPGWDRRTDLKDAIPVVWPDPDHDVDGVQGTQLGLSDASAGREPSTDCGHCQQRLKTDNFDRSYEIQSQRPLALKAPATGASTTSSYCEEEIKALAYLAKHYACSDEYFSGLAGPTVPNRMLALTCDTPEDSHHNPEGGKELLEYLRGMKKVPTLFEKLEEAPVLDAIAEDPWRVYFRDTPLSIFLTHLKNESHGSFRRFDEFKTDVTNDDLPVFSFLEPRYYDRGDKYADDQHPPHHIGLGDELIADVYETLRSNPSLFRRTLLIITYDEHGGSYDHVVPPLLQGAPTVELSRLGLRVPCVFVSPSVPKMSVVRRNGTHGPDGALISEPSSQPGGVLNHASLSATFHRWFKTNFLNERDASSATFCSVWQPNHPLSSRELPSMPKVTVPRQLDGKPVGWSPYPDTGVFLYAECLVADFYLSMLRPSLNTSPQVDHSFLRDAIARAADLLKLLAKESKFAQLTPVFNVAMSGLDGLSGHMTRNRGLLGDSTDRSIIDDGKRAVLTMIGRLLLAPVKLIKRLSAHKQASAGSSALGTWVAVFEDMADANLSAVEKSKPSIMAEKTDNDSKPIKEQKKKQQKEDSEEDNDESKEEKSQDKSEDSGKDSGSEEDSPRRGRDKKKGKNKKKGKGGRRASGSRSKSRSRSRSRSK